MIARLLALIAGAPRDQSLSDAATIRVIYGRDGETALDVVTRLAVTVRRMEMDRVAGFRIARELTMETQSVEACCDDLVNLIRDARRERDVLRRRLNQGEREQLLHLATLPSPPPALDDDG